MLAFYQQATNHNQGLLAEILTSLFLYHTVLMVAVDFSRLHGALAIGMAVTVGILVA